MRLTHLATAGGLAASLLPAAALAHPPSFSVLYSFSGGAEGAYPFACPSLDSAGNLYGSTQAGGNAAGLNGAGTIYKLTGSGISVLHSFAGGTDGGIAIGGVTLDKAGDVFGTTEANAAPNGGGQASGTVFKIAPDLTETVLHYFDPTKKNGAIGPDDRLTAHGGAYYSTTFVGGGGALGTIFKITQAGTLKLLYHFTGGADGGVPYATVVFDSAGNLYGTTSRGGAGFGVVYKLTPPGVLSILHSFQGGADGAAPAARLIIDAAGTLYGTTSGGDVATDFGTVFKLTPDGTETLLYSFKGGADGQGSIGPLLAKGSTFYGTTSGGGAASAGTVYKLSAAGVKTILHSFTVATDGGSPFDGVVVDKAGALYGTAETGGTGGYGTVFRIVP